MLSIKKAFNWAIINHIYLKAGWFLSPWEPLGSTASSFCAANIPCGREQVSLRQKCIGVLNSSAGWALGRVGAPGKAGEQQRAGAIFRAGFFLQPVEECGHSELHHGGWCWGPWHTAASTSDCGEKHLASRNHGIISAGRDHQASH